MENGIKDHEQLSDQISEKIIGKDVETAAKILDKMKMFMYNETDSGIPTIITADVDLRRVRVSISEDGKIMEVFGIG